MTPDFFNWFYMMCLCGIRKHRNSLWEAGPSHRSALYLGGVAGSCAASLLKVVELDAMHARCAKLRLPSDVLDEPSPLVLPTTPPPIDIIVEGGA